MLAKQDPSSRLFPMAVCHALKQDFRAACRQKRKTNHQRPPAYRVPLRPPRVPSSSKQNAEQKPTSSTVDGGSRVTSEMGNEAP